MITDPETLKQLLTQGALSPLEETLEIKRKKGALFIGIPKEISFQENRVALTPEAVSLLTANGHRVRVESKAGIHSRFTDNEYSECGAEISPDAKSVFECDIVLKVAPPTEQEIEMMPGRQTLISALQLSVQPKEILEKLSQKKITAVAWDYIQDDHGIFPIVRSMGEIAGNTSILIASELLSNPNGKGMMFGGITGVQPTEVVIIGSGTVGEYAARSAMGLGASVKVFDTNIAKLRRLQNDIGQRVFTSVLQPKLISKALLRADVVIGAMRAPLGRTPCVVSEEMVEQMKPGSVLIDVSIDQGGCFETSKITNHNEPIFLKHGVIHYCVPNIASRVSRTASFALSNIFSPILIDMGERGGVVEHIRSEIGFRNGIYMYKGTLTSEILGRVFNLPYKDIELLILGL
jgi:alanine dehydrogenase